MKRVFVKMVLAISLMMVPVTVFALDSISDTAMDSVSGQAGISIAITEAIDMNVKIESFKMGIGETGIKAEMADSSANGMHINIKQDDAAKSMTLNMTAQADGTLISVGLPAATIVVENMPDVKLSVTSGTTTSSLANMSVGKTTLKTNAGKVDMKILK